MKNSAAAEKEASNISGRSGRFSEASFSDSSRSDACSSSSGGWRDRERKRSDKRKHRNRTSSNESHLDNERTRKQRRRPRLCKKVVPHSADREISSDESGPNKKHRTESCQAHKKERDKDEEKRRKKGHRRKEKRLSSKEKFSTDSGGPLQLSKYLSGNKDDGVRRSVISGKKIHLKVEKSKEDKLAESKRNELLKFLNASYD